MEPFTIQPGESVQSYLARHKAYQERHREAEKESCRKADQARRNAAERAEARYLFLTLPKCDDCGGKEFQTMRTEGSGEVTTRRVTCKSCGSRFLMVLE
jgi:DNA-directed RNA polymerase subunit M/transcription elongation factor TFIIS